MSPIGDNRRTRGQLDADFLIVADGANSQLRRWLAAPEFPVRHSAFALRQYLDGLRLPLPRTIQVFYLRELLPYYGWVFPLSESRANVGVGAAAGRLRFPERDEPGLRALLSGFLQNPLVEGALGGPAPGGQSQTVGGHPLHFASGIRPARSPLVLDRAIFAGDAAGLIHPLSGEGIDFALESGELAALSIRAAADSGDFRAAGLALQAYQQHCYQRWIAPCERAANLRWLLRRPRLVDRYFRAVQDRDLRAPGPGHAAARLAGTLFGNEPRLDCAAVFRALWLPR
jgi:flavin-dependent dehydrogenase